MENTSIKYKNFIIPRLHQLQDALSFFYNQQNESEKGIGWQKIFDLNFKKKTGKPSPSWLSHQRLYIEEIGVETYHSYLIGFLKKLIQLLKDILKYQIGDNLYFLHEKFQELYKGLLWSAALYLHPELPSLLTEIALLSLKKIPSHGVISKKLGNACLYALSALPEQKGITNLLQLKSKTTYPSVKKTIDKYIQDLAKRLDKSPDDIEELAVPTFGFDEQGCIYRKFGTYHGIIELSEDSGLSSKWLGEKDKPIRQLPPRIREEYAVEIKQFKLLFKAIKTALSVQRKRLESLFLKKRQWLYKDWKKLYTQIPIIAHLSFKLIWTLQSNGQQSQALYRHGKWTTPTVESLDFLDNNTFIKLWHPVASSAQEVLDWRTFLIEREIQQPFKQAFREIYLLTDAERTTHDYSNRFAAHILKQHQFAALCKTRHWNYKLKGYWNSDSIPTCLIPSYDMSAEFWVDIDWNGERTPSNAFTLIFTDQVRFYYQEELIALEEVPVLVFSEVMRDVDLFVGVTSIGNDPEWQNRNEQHTDYWNSYSFSELNATAKTRKSILENVIPKLKISKQCKIEGRFLVVNGNLRTYKIHIGSGNILMEPNDEYLCIVPKQNKKSHNEIFLPFEGDQMLSIIISKAMLLAADTKIKDPVILNQLR